jgi:ATP-dependent exoDNAse (exonuclease V) alpha subunit
VSLELTKGQEQARLMIEKLLDEDEAKFAVLSGYAGTGKTTMLKVVAQEQGEPLILTPTGKAALRVAEATGIGAQTLHKWMYKASEDPKTGEPRWAKKPVNEIQLPTNGLVVIDEASMVSEEIWRDLWMFCSSIGLKVVLVGDKFQLPPVVKKDENGSWKTFSALTDLKTDYRTDLTEVCRQALDSPIIKASMMIRQGEMQAMDAIMDILPSTPANKLVESFLKQEKGQRALIAHTNAKRQALNLEVRKALGYDSRHIEAGEPLLVLMNNYHLDRFNGEVVTFAGWKQTPDPAVAVRDRFKNISSMISFGLANIEGRDAVLSQEEIFAQASDMPTTTIRRAAGHHAVDKWGYDKTNAPPHLNANLGYCLTAHKSQGSEWNDVTVVIEPSVGGRQGAYGLEGRRWAYTAITRARKNVSVCFTNYDSL